MNMMDDLIRNIRTDLRLAMNGVVSSSMRDKGMDYKMNFGVDIPRLKGIALKYEHTAALADAIWDLDVREMKILATMVYPLDQFSESKADEWANKIPNQEIREHMCRNLFQNLPFSHALVQKWTKSENPSMRLTGYWLYVRLMLVNADALENIDKQLVIEQALKDIQSEESLLRSAALNVLKYTVRKDEKSAHYIMSQISGFATSECPADNELFNDLSFENEHRS